MYKLAAVIVESRPLPNLVEIIRDHHLHFLPEDTQLILFHGEANYEMLKEAFPKAGFSNINGLVSEAQYNWLLTQARFWELLQEYDRVLVAQADSGLLRTGIEEFYEWDYVGAPWKWDTAQELGGNGGCCLRNPKIMLEICNKYGFNRSVLNINEDHWFCMMMKEYKIGKVAPREVQLRWGTETIFSLGTFSYHAIDRWLSSIECEQIKNQYKKQE